MFEKEAEEILNNYCDCELLPECISGIRCRCSDFEEKKKLLLEGIEFGYNKANEWHNLRKNPNDLPERKQVPQWHKVADADLPEAENHFWSRTVLIKTNKGSSIIGFYDHANKAWYEKSTDDIVYGVIAWCEIPKYTEE